VLLETDWSSDLVAGIEEGDGGRAQMDGRAVRGGDDDDSGTMLMLGFWR
jgi:hypothetical protein